MSIKIVTKVIKLFPLKALLTKDTIEKSYKHDIHNCTGALVLKKLLGSTSKDIEVVWGSNDGQLIINNFVLTIGAFDNLKNKFNLFNVNKEVEVYFEVTNINNYNIVNSKSVKK